MTKSLLSSLIFSEAANLGLKAEIKEKKKTEHNTTQRSKRERKFRRFTNVAKRPMI